MVVLRGGPDTATKLAGHARRTNDVFCLDREPVWGVSVFLALDDVGPASLDRLPRDRLVSYRLVHTAPAVELVEAGFSLLPTFRRPHFTLLLASDGELDIRRLLNTLGPPQVNPYHGPARR